MLRLLLLSLLIFQTDAYHLQQQLAVKADFFTTDNLGNFYLVKGDELQKYNQKGALLLSYSSKGRGDITFVDAANPLKILLFYKDFSKLLFLDNMLAESSNVMALGNMNYYQAELACTSYNNGFWIYDKQNFELIRFDQNSSLQVQTGNLEQLLSVSLEPNFLLEYNNQLYLNNPSSGVLVFDVFGSYLKTIPIKNGKALQIRDEVLYVNAENALLSYHLKLIQQDSLTLPKSTFLKARIENEKIYVLDDKGVSIYSK